MRNQDRADIRTQYKDDRNLNARLALHVRFSTNPYGWERWVFDAVEKSARGAEPRILELGCGPATLWAANRQRVPAAWAITLTDYSAGMIEAAQDADDDGEARFTFANADAQAIPFPPASFDLVIANHMLYHVPDRARAFEEIARVLKPGGTLLAATNGERHMQELWALVEPFDPEVRARVGRISRGFTLENGPAQLEAVFDDVERRDYDDALEVTEPEPLIAYLASSMALSTRLGAGEYRAIQEQAAAQIAEAGAYHIHKASGLLAARRRPRH